MEATRPGSVSLLIQRAQAGDEAAGQALLQRLHRDFQPQLHAQLRVLQHADRDAVVNDMLFRLYGKLVSGHFDIMKTRVDLWKMIGSINRKCRSERWKRSHTKKAQKIQASSLPENYEPAATGARPDELAMFDDSFRSCHAAIEQYIHKNPDAAFMRHMFRMIIDGHRPADIKEQLGLSRHAYDTRRAILLRICAGDSDDQQ